MINKFSITVLICFVTFLSCSDKNSKKDEPTANLTTPEILTDNETDIKISSISKRYDANIIEELFDEAIAKDSKLKVLSDKLDNMSKIKNDSLESFRKYSQNNDNYWSTVDTYIKRINDSTLKRETQATFDTLKAKYKSRISKHNYYLDKLDTKTMLLEDQTILLRLFVAGSMMNNYQINELPDVRTIKRLIYGYDTLSKETKQYFEIVD